MDEATHAGLSAAEIPVSSSMDLDNVEVRSPEPAHSIANTGRFHPFLARYLCVLREAARDFDGIYRPPGSRVIAEAGLHSSFRPDTPANRSAFIRGNYAWSSQTRSEIFFPPVATVSKELKSLLAIACQTASAFLEIVLGNLGCSAITKTDVSGTVADVVARSGKADLKLPEDWKDLLQKANRGVICNPDDEEFPILVVFITPLKFQPHRHPKIRPSPIDVLRDLRDVLNLPDQSRVALGSLRATYRQGCPATAPDGRVIASTLEKGTWRVESAPPVGNARRLVPESEQRRIAAVRNLLNTQFSIGKSRITLDEIHAYLPATLIPLTAEEMSRAARMCGAEFARSDGRLAVTRPNSISSIGLRRIQKILEWTRGGEPR